MAAQPVFLFTCGGWHTTEYWGPVRERLEKFGYSSSAVPLASVDASPANADMTEDVAAIHAATKELVDSGKDVIVVFHSYGGQPGSDAMKGLGKKERSEQGLKGGVVRLVFIMAYIVPEGFQAAKPGDTSTPPPPWMAIDMATMTVTVSPEDAKKVFYNDLPDAEADEWAKKLRPWSIGCAFSTSTYAGWRTIPSTYVLTDQDNSHFGQWGKVLLEGAKANQPTAVDTVEEVSAGHCPMLSKPDWTTEMLKRAAVASSA